MNEKQKQEALENDYDPDTEERDDEVIATSRLVEPVQSTESLQQDAQTSQPIKLASFADPLFSKNSR